MITLAEGLKIWLIASHMEGDGGCKNTTEEDSMQEGDESLQPTEGCACFLDRQERNEKYLKEMLEIANIHKESHFTNHITVLWVDIPYICASTSTTLTSQLQALCNALTDDKLPRLQELSIIALKDGKTEISTSDKGKAGEILEQLQILCQDRGFSLDTNLEWEGMDSEEEINDTENEVHMDDIAIEVEMDEDGELIASEDDDENENM